MIRTSIGNINLGFDIQQPLMKKRVVQHYKEFLSKNKPDVWIKVENKDFQVPLKEKLIFEGENWKIYEKEVNKFIYFINELNESLAKCGSTLEVINFYTKDKKGQILLYLFPEILFSWLSPSFDSLMFHACGVTDNEKNYLFVALDGGGKSTIAKLAIKEGFTVLNDDRIIVSRKKRDSKSTELLGMEK